MADFRKFTWLLALIASILMILSLFTPARIYNSTPYGEMLGWLGGGIMLELDSGILHEDLYSQLLFGATIVSITLLLTISINTKRGNEYKWDWLVYLILGIVIIILTIFFWLFEFDPAFETISFSSIGIFIAGVISILAFAFDKFSTDRNKTTKVL
ncbi:MAG: hypothetical protein ACFE8N_08235 [Promethearchaeota archaeon]